MKLKRILGILLTITMLMSLLPIFSLTASAAEAISYIERSWNGSHVESVTKTVTDYTIINSNIINWSNGWYVVRDNTNIGYDITVTGEANLILCDGVTLTSKNAITVGHGNTLNIYSQFGDTGSLKVTKADNDYPAIGDIYAAGTINIHGGIITAPGGLAAAGIGTGWSGSGSNITIYGGTITATGGERGAGIGSGSGSVTSSNTENNSSSIAIYGGTVIATGGAEAAGIGTGKNSDNATITIGGGTVTAIGGKYGAGIGTGRSGDNVKAIITGGTVTANGGTYAAGIGGGYYGSGGNVTISGGTITADGGLFSAGIGGGYYGSGGNVIVTGGNVKATGAELIDSSGTITDGKGNNVSLHTITLDELSEASPISSVNGVTYGLKDVKTIDTNSLYFYLPSDSKLNYITADKTIYCSAGSTTNFSSERHTPGKEYVARDEIHLNICIYCGQECNDQAHVGGSSTCLSVGYCDLCGAGYIPLNKDNHVTEDTYYTLNNDGTHSLYHSCCDALVSSDAHTPSETTCLGVSKCSVCNFSYTSEVVDENNHVGGVIECFQADAGHHIYKWSCCGMQEGQAEPHDFSYNANDETDTILAKCGTCGAEGSATMHVEGGEYNGKKYEATYSATGVFDDWRSIVKPSFTYSGENGCIDAGTHTAYMTLGTATVSKEIIITPITLELSNITSHSKEYDATNIVTVHGYELKNVVVYDKGSYDGEWDDVRDDVAIDTTKLSITTSSPLPTEYTTCTISGIELIGADKDNYLIANTIENAPLRSPYGIYEITHRQIWIIPENQQIIQGGTIDGSAYGVAGLDNRFALTGVELFVDYNRNIAVNTDNAKITLGEEDVTEYFFFTTNIAIYTEVCEGHQEDENGFCSTGNCDNYQSAILNGNNTFDQEYDDYYEIYNAGQLYWYAQQINEYGCDKGAKLMNDIYVNEDLHAENLREWTPINGLYAEFNGNGFLIDGLYINQPDRDYIGFLGRDGYGSVKNLTITNSYFKGNDNVGTFGGNTGAEFINCVADSSVTVVGAEESQNVGGIAGGYSGGTFTNNISYANVSGAGLIGYCMGYATNSYTTSDKAVTGFYPGYGEITGFYYMNDEEVDEIDGTTAMSADDFASGKLAYLLQSNVPEEDIFDDDWNWIETITPHVWGQKIGTDSYPVIGGEKVYFANGCYFNEVTDFAIANYHKTAKTAVIASPEVGTYTVIFADYDGEKLANVEYATVTFTEGTKGTVLPVSITKDFNLDLGDKIMIWSDITNLVPKCEAYIVK